MKQINIALLGFGTVGTGVYEILQNNREHIEKKHGLKINISKILVHDKNKERKIKPSENVLTDDITEIITDDSIDLVVEVMSGEEPAATYMLQALKNSKHVVTANKAALANNYTSLIKVAKDHNMMIKFEASVAGGVPIINTITSSLHGDEFTELMGIVNGTCNYILSKMTKENMDYQSALDKAKELGFAESDPSADVDGIDSANKLSILIALLFDKHILPQDISTIGISNITLDDIIDAKNNGKKIKLIASAQKTDNQLTYSVKPMLIDNDSPLYTVDNEYNAIYLKGNAVGEIMLQGKGAGALPTGSAVVSDIISIANTL